MEWLVIAVAAAACADDRFTTATDGGPNTPPDADARPDAALADGGNTGDAGCGSDRDAHNCGTCGHDCFGGACVSGACRPFVLQSDGAAPYGIATTGARVFWTSHGTETVADGSLQAIDPDGSNMKSLAGLLPGPAFLAADAATMRVYFASNGSLMNGYNDGSFAVVNFDGGGLRVMAGGLHPHASSIALHGGVVFWLSSEVGGGTAAADLTNPTNPTTTPMFSGASPFALAIGTNAVVTTELGDGPTFKSNSHVARFGFDGGARADLLPFPNRPRGVAIKNDIAYWTTELDGAVYRSNLGVPDSATVTLAGGLLAPMGIAVDANFVYVTCQGTSQTVDGGAPAFAADGSVVRIPIAGCAGPGCPQVIADHQGWPFGIAVDDGALYWVNRGSGQVMEMRK